MTAVWFLIISLAIMAVFCAAEYGADRYAEHLKAKRKQAVRRKLDRNLM